MTRATLNILKSPEVIAINQDPLGVPGDLVWKQGPQEVTCCFSFKVRCTLLHASDIAGYASMHTYWSEGHD